MRTSPLFVSFATPDPLYQGHAKRLRESLNRLGLLHMSRTVEPGPWVEVCARKADFILGHLRRDACPIAWLDADAIVAKRPDLLFDCTADFAVSTFAAPRIRRCVNRLHTLPPDFPDPPRWFNSGTVYIAPTPLGIALAERWAKLCAANPRDWDQWHLQQAWCDVRPETLWLPDSYCATRLTNGEVVISQGFASTEHKADRG